MTPQFAKSIDPLLLHVLALLDHAAGANPQEERLKIRALLDQGEGRQGQSQDWQLAKYALVSWIDEVLIDAEWPGRDWWRENALEGELYMHRLANEEFYVKAREASALPRRDALEVFYVCVVLGFRGLYRDPHMAPLLAQSYGLPESLDTWAKQTSLAIQLGKGRPPIAEGGMPGPGAPPLTGKSWAVWSSLAGAILLGFVVVSARILFFQQ